MPRVRLNLSTFPFCQGQCGRIRRCWTSVASSAAAKSREFDVVHGVVGHDLPHGDAVSGEPGHGPGPEAGAGGAAFVGQDLGVGQPRMVIDGGVDVVVAEPSLAVGPLAASVHAPAAIGWDPAELLDVDVDQVPGPVAFVPQRRRTGRTDHHPGDRVQARQGRAGVTGQDPGHGAGRDPGHGGDLVASDPVGVAAGQHLGLDRGRGAGRARPGPSRTGRADRPSPRCRSGAPTATRTGVRHPSRLRRARPGGRPAGSGGPARTGRGKSGGR